MYLCWWLSSNAFRQAPSREGVSRGSLIDLFCFLWWKTVLNRSSPSPMLIVTPLLTPEDDRSTDWYQARLFSSLHAKLHIQAHPIALTLLNDSLALAIHFGEDQR